ncbi:acidic amino acid decarboxylase GADL1-like [Onthophagus taurus]|uniref:acidic amino acid decarboxylase GADL1-like n=1 Tax=Onthophagus taurus TaxID=166361 RepID=UPI000C204D8B|nr:acidic amino acid decarboxylase GADL1-like [Onthophagus taurus]
MVDYKPFPVKEIHGDFLMDVVDILFKHIVFTNKTDKVVLWKSPDNLQNLFDLEVQQNGDGHEKLLSLIKSTIKYSVRTGHPYFINQLFSGLDPYGLAGQWLTDALNASVYTYEVAPVFTLMESCIIKEMCRMIGAGWSDGIFCPGGSTGNGIALNLARYNFCSNIKRMGSFGVSRLVIFASEECHYSIPKFTSFIGIGEDNLIEVPTDELGQMIPKELETLIQKQLQENNTPIAVVATMGTTVRGAFDPINQIASICARYKIWLHVDAAWGGGLIFSQRYRSKLNGIERANSVVINPHKLLAVPQQCSVLLVRDPNILHECHSKEAEYLFQKDKYYDNTFDHGDKYLQCGRKCDVFKFWFMWKAKGTSGFANHVNDLMEIAEYFEEQIHERREFMMASKRQYMNVCFWYLPRYLQGKPDILEYRDQLHKVAPQIKAVMVKHGSVMLNYQPLKNYPNFFRFVSQNSALNKKDVDFILDYISHIGKAIYG